MRSLHGLVVAGLAVAGYIVVVYGGTLLVRAKRAERAGLAVLVLLAFPLCAWAFYGLRLPLDALVRAFVGASHPAYPWIALAYAPLTEEPAKLLPLALLSRRRALDPSQAAWAVGMGFGAGEALFVALRASESVPDLPWYVYAPFMLERFEVALVHGMMTRVAWMAMACGGRGALGALMPAMTLHLLLNLPILLAALGWLGDDRAAILRGLALWVMLWWGAAWARFTLRPPA
jgi:hypothetical protein